MYVCTQRVAVLCFGDALWFGSEHKGRSSISCAVSRLDTQTSQTPCGKHGTLLLLLARHVCIWMKFIIVITSVYPTLVHLQYRNRITKSGELVITSQRHRTQRKNLEDAVLRLDGILSEASELPKGPSQLTVARIKAL